jgi:hypothetical protein
MITDDGLAGLVLTAAWIAGIVVAKGVWWKLASVFFVFPAWYFLAEAILQHIGFL